MSTKSVGENKKKGFGTFGGFWWLPPVSWEILALPDGSASKNPIFLLIVFFMISFLKVN